MTSSVACCTRALLATGFLWTFFDPWMQSRNVINSDLFIRLILLPLPHMSNRRRASARKSLTVTRAMSVCFCVYLQYEVKVDDDVCFDAPRPQDSMAMIVNGLLSLRAGILKYDTANKSNVFDQSGALVHTLTLATDQGNELGGNKPDAEATAKAAADERKWKMMQQQLDEAAEVAAKKEAEKKVEEEQRVGSRACESPEHRRPPYAYLPPPASADPVSTCSME
jgi:hypothetical protein